MCHAIEFVGEAQQELGAQPELAEAVEIALDGDQLLVRDRRVVELRQVAITLADRDAVVQPGLKGPVRGVRALLDLIAVEPTGPDLEP